MSARVADERSRFVSVETANSPCILNAALVGFSGVVLVQLSESDRPKRLNRRMDASALLVREREVVAQSHAQVRTSVPPSPYK